MKLGSDTDFCWSKQGTGKVFKRFPGLHGSESCFRAGPDSISGAAAQPVPALPSPPEVRAPLMMGPVPRGVAHFLRTDIQVDKRHFKRTDWITAWWLKTK